MSTLLAPAKLNLFLSVGDVRPDGFHAVTAVNAVLDYGDEVRIEPSDALSVICEPDVGVVEHENLAWRAARAMSDEFARDATFRIRIEKRIPAGAGLGGGSSDAATVVAAIAAHWGIDRDDPRIEKVARSLGADVVLFLAGGCGVYAGRGDVLRRSLPVPVGRVAIVWPRAHISTAEAYRAFDAAPRQPRPAPRALTDAICFREAAAIGSALHNNMTASSLPLAPVTAEALALVERMPGCLGAAMAGSGSAVFGLFASEPEADAVVAEGQSRGWWAHAAGFSGSGALDAAYGPKPTLQPRGRSARNR